MEENLIYQCQQGELSAFEKLYLNHVKGVYQFIYYKTCRHETTEDLTSNTFIKAMEKIHQYNSNKASFKTWLYQIARNQVIDHYRQYKSIQNIEDTWDIKSNENITHKIDSQLKVESIQKYLKTLKPIQREIILLRLWGEKSFSEIAEITGKNEAACKMNFKRTLEKIKNEFPLFTLLILLTQPL